MRSASIRTRLAALFGATFLVAGLTLVGVNYFLVDTEIRNLPEGGRRAFVDEFGIELPGFAGRQGVDAIPGGLGDIVLENGRTLREAAESFEARLRADLLNSILVQSLIALAIIAVIAGFVGWLVSRRALDPVAEITKTARTFTEANLSQRVALEGPPDELKELADTFDEMLDRVERGYADQSSFAAYASHELRTPLSVMRVEADNLLADVDATDRERALARTVQQEVDRSERLISQLLSITRSRSGRLVNETVDLVGIVGEVVAGAVPVADAHGIELDLSLGDALVDGDSSLLRSLIRNLVVNGILHNKEGGGVTITVDSDAAGAFLTVANSGPLLTDADVRRMYRPFERIEEDRTSGVGLGLAVVGAISEAHGATVEAVPDPDGGVSTTVRFSRSVPV
jgi:signal transduction histidine kinase